MEESLKSINDALRLVQASNKRITDRLTSIENKLKTTSPTLAVPINKSESEQARQVVNKAKEKSLLLTFGDDDSPLALRLFLDHYNLAKQQNMRRGVEGWSDPTFRANELRFQLRGAPGAWVSQESAMMSVWVLDDVELIAQLKKRYLGMQSVEMTIMAFEELKQGEGESSEDYMARCQQKGYEAFGGFDNKATNQRIVFKFLSGLRDGDVRNEVLKEKWMQSETECRPFEEVLKLAEGVKKARNGGSDVARLRRGISSRASHSSSESTSSLYSSNSTGLR